MEGRPIAVDLDGTAWDFLRALQRQPECTPEIARAIDPELCDTWEAPFVLLGPEVMERARSIEMLREIGFYPGFIEAMERLQEKGFRPVLLSHNSDAVIQNFSVLLVEAGLNVECLPARPAEKIAWCKENEAVALIDDAPETLLLAKEAGIPAFTFRYLYNAREIDESGATSVSPEGGWLALVSAIEQGLRPSLESSDVCPCRACAESPDDSPSLGD